VTAIFSLFFGSSEKKVKKCEKNVCDRGLMDIFLMAGLHQQPEQSNYLAEGQP